MALAVHIKITENPLTGLLDRSMNVRGYSACPETDSIQQGLNSAAHIMVLGCKRISPFPRFVFVPCKFESVCYRSMFSLL